MENHVYMHVCIYIHVCIMYVSTHVHMYVLIYVCSSASLKVCNTRPTRTLTITKSMKMKSKVSPDSAARSTALTAVVPSSASSMTALDNLPRSLSSIRRMILRLSAESSWRNYPSHSYDTYVCMYVYDYMLHQNMNE